MRSVTLLACWAVLAAGVAPAAAQRIESPYRFVDNNQTVGLLAGHISPAAGPLELGPESAVAFGARYGITITGPFVAELELLFAPATRPVRDTAFTTGPDSTHVVVGEADMNLLLGMANIRFNVTGARSWHGLQPFALFGAGLVTDLAGDAAAEDSIPQDVRLDFGTGFAGQVGIGAEYHFSQRWALRADARSALWKLKNPTAFRVQDEDRLLPADQWENNTVITAGLSIRF